MIKKISVQDVLMEEDVKSKGFVSDEDNFNDLEKFIKQTNDNVKFFRDNDNRDIQNLIKNNFLTKGEYDNCFHLYQIQNKKIDKRELEINGAIEKFDKIYKSSNIPINKSYFSPSEQLELQCMLLQLSNFINNIYNNLSIIMEKTYFCDVVNEILEFDNLFNKMRKSLYKVRVLSIFNEYFDVDDQSCITSYLNDIADINNELSKLYNVNTHPESFSIREYTIYKDSVLSPIKNFDKIYAMPATLLKSNEKNIKLLKNKYLYKNIFNKTLIPIEKLSQYNASARFTNKRKHPMYIYKNKRKTNEDYVTEDVALERRKRIFEGKDDSLNDLHKKLRTTLDSSNSNGSKFQSVFSLSGDDDDYDESDYGDDDDDYEMTRDEEIIYSDDHRLNSTASRQIDNIGGDVDFNLDGDVNMSDGQIEKYKRVVGPEDYDEYYENIVDPGSVHIDELLEYLPNKTIDTLPGTSKKAYWKLK